MTVDQADLQGYEIYCFSDPAVRSGDRQRNEALGFECIEFEEEMCAKQFTLYYLGTRPKEVVHVI